jgi:hypothetical protein
MRLNQAWAALKIGDNDRAVSSHFWRPAERQQHRTLRDSKRWYAAGVEDGKAAQFKECIGMLDGAADGVG